MNTRGRAIIITAGVFGLINSAHATDWTGAEIKTLLSGKTAYFETTAASSSRKAGQAVNYFAPDDTALFKTPTGAMWHGAWEVKGNTNCTNWKERPGTGCI
jgi:hypothetical protein